jgi:hypothetical protein
MYYKISDFIEDWKYESESTIKVLSNLTDDSLTKNFGENIRTPGRLAWHIVGAISELGYRMGLTFEEIDQDAPFPSSAKEIIDEYLRVLTYPKFKLSEEEINFLLYQQILPYFDVIDVQPGPGIIKKDPEDDKFIWCAIAGKVKFIISGDRHLLALKFYRKIKILSPADFIKTV